MTLDTSLPEVDYYGIFPLDFMTNLADMCRFVTALLCSFTCYDKFLQHDQGPDLLHVSVKFTCETVHPHNTFIMYFDHLLDINVCS